MCVLHALIFSIMLYINGLNNLLNRHFFLLMYRTIEITKITGQDEKSAKSEEPKTMVCTL